LKLILDSHVWNSSGERVWLAPEGLFNYTDPLRIIETYRVDPRLDPARWRMERADNVLQMNLDAEVDLTDGRGPVGFEITRRIEALEEESRCPEAFHLRLSPSSEHGAFRAACPVARSAGCAGRHGGAQFRCGLARGAGLWPSARICALAAGGLVAGSDPVSSRRAMNGAPSARGVSLSSRILKSRARPHYCIGH
jgi:hypothetical protein